MMPILNVVLIELGSLFLILLNYLLDRLMILLLILCLTEFVEGSLHGLLVPALEKDYVLWRILGLILLYGIIHMVFAGISLKAPDIALIDLNVHRTGILFHKLFKGLLALCILMRF